MQTRVTVKGVRDIQLKLITMADRSRDIRPAYRAMGAQFRARAREVFATNNYGRWAPLDASTLRGRYMSKRKQGPAKGGPHQILHDMGVYRKSWTASHKRGNISRIYGGHAEFGSQHPLVRFHEHGTRIMPKRSVLDGVRKVRVPDGYGNDDILLSWITNGNRAMPKFTASDRADLYD